MLVAYLLIAATVLIYLLKDLINSFWYSLYMKGPPALPLLGNSLMLINKTPTEFSIVLYDTYTKYGKMVRFWLGLELHMYVGDSDVVELVLSSQKLIDKSDSYLYMKTWLGDGLLLSTGKKWFSRRKAITPTFHFKILDQFVKVFNKHSDIFVKVLQKYSDKGESVDFYPLINLYTLDIICESAMGTSLNAQLNSESEYVQAVKEISQIMIIRMFDYILRFSVFFRFSSYYRKQMSALKVLHGFTHDVIKRRRTELLQFKNDANTCDEGIDSEEELGIKKRMGLLDVLLKSNIDGRPLDDNEIREEVDTFMFEGHDTTTSAICFTFYNLAKYPSIQRKVVDEILNVLGDDVTSPISLSQLNELHYTELVIRETLRLYPSVPLLARKVGQNININGKIIPKGTNLLLSPFLIGRDPDIYEDPEEFLPERFDVLKTAEHTNPYSYIPFSAGPRQKFAMLELKSAIVKLLKNFELHLPEDHEEPVLVPELILRPLNGMPLKLTKRVF